MRLTFLSKAWNFVVDPRILWESHSCRKLEIFVADPRSCETHILVESSKFLWQIREFFEARVFFLLMWKLCGYLMMFWALQFCRKLEISMAELRNVWDSHSCRKLEIFVAVWISFKIRMIFAHSIGHTFIIFIYHIFLCLLSTIFM